MRHEMNLIRCAKPILLFNDECGVCRWIAQWVFKSAQTQSVEPSMIVRPIGEDPAALKALNPDLDVWNAYATIHLLMPDGSMRLGGEAVAEVLRHLTQADWFTWTFAVSIFGLRPFQAILNVAYTILADVRPIFGCESCGTPSPWVRPISWIVRWTSGKFGESHPPSRTPHFTSLPAKGR